MEQTIIFISSGVTAFFAHDWTEKRLTQNGKKQIRLVVKGYQIHHSFFGMLAIFYAILVASGGLAAILIGYGLGNIWQHKVTHNRVNENGLVFISKT